MGDTETAVSTGPSPSLPTLTRDLGRSARYKALVGAVGAGLLTGGTALGLFSRFGTAPVAVRDTYAQAGHVAGAAAVAGGLVLAIAVAAWFAGRSRQADLWSTHHRWELGATATVALVLGFLGVMSWNEHLPSSYTTLRTEMPYFEQLTTSVGALALVAIGSILVLPLAFHMGVARTLRRGTSTAAMATGLAIAAAVSVVAVRAGDDRLNVDHSTAAPTPVPAAADRFGTEAFRLQLPPLNNRPEATGREVIAAGTGFLVIGVDGLRAFDGATGEPRWHYLRRPQSGTRTLIYDRGSAITAADGAIVTTRWTGRSGTRRITFDAVTGQILWTSDDHTDFTSDDHDSPARLLEAPASDTLIVETDTAVKGYDARTAARRWVTPVAESGCRSSDVGTRVTADAVYRVLRCGGSIWRVIAIDTATGGVIGHRDYPASPSNKPTLTLLQNMTLIDFWTPDNPAYMLVEKPDQLATSPLRTSGSPFAAAADGSDLLVGLFDPTTRQSHVDLATYDGTSRTRVPEMSPSSPNSGAVHVLAEEIIALEYDTSLRLSRWPRRNPTSPTAVPIEATCRPKATQPTLLPVPASILVVCQNNEEIGDATLDIIGYR